MPDVALRLLGVPRVAWGDREEPLPRNTPASLLAYLALAGDWVARTELAYLYRPDDDEASALQYLRLQLHRAQRLPWAAGLEVRAHEVRWVVATDHARLREAHRRQDWVGAIAAYGGPFLETFDRGDRPTFDAWVELERGEAERLYGNAVEARAEALAADGRFAEAAESWRARVALDELDEDAARAYLRALARAGRKDDALRHYRRFADLLRREFDLEPADETRSLADRIRSDDPDVAAPPATPSRPVRDALPQPATRFVGRRRELAEIHRTLVDEGARLATLVGLGGSGKTRLALAFAHAHRGAFDGGAVFVAAESVTEAESLADRVAVAFGLELDVQRPVAGQLVDHLADRQALVVIDNVEQVDGVEGLLGELLTGTRHMRVVATSRRPLRLSGEWLLDVRGLAHPADEAALEAGIDDDAVELFVAAARRVAPQLAFDADDLRHVARICRLLEGLPLGLELAAAWTRVMPVARIADEIERGFDLLASDLVDVPERHRSMRAVLDRTWDDLTAAKKRTLARLSVFAGGCTLDAAERVTGAHLSTLLSLVNQSLLQRQPGERFASHPLVRQYASAALATDPSEASDALDAHARYFAERLRSAHDGTAGRNDALRALQPDAANLERAWFRLLEIGDLQAAEAAAGPQFAFYDHLGHDRRGLEVCAATLERLGPPGGTTAALRCTVQLAGATMAREAGVLDLARAYAEDAVAVAGEHGLAGLVARGNQYLGDVHQTTGAYADAEAAYALAIARFEALGNTLELANTLNSLASMEAMQERYDAASERFRRCVELFEVVDDPLAKAIALNNLGYIAEAQGRHAVAAEHYEAGLAVFERLAFARGIAAAKNNLVVLYGVLGRLDEAEAIGLESLALKRSIQDTLGTIVTLKNLGDLQLRRGALDAAVGHYLPAIRTARELAAVPRLLQVLVSYADYAGRAGLGELARRLLDALLRHPLATPSIVARVRELHPDVQAGAASDPSALDAVVDEILAVA